MGVVQHASGPATYHCGFNNSYYGVLFLLIFIPLSTIHPYNLPIRFAILVWGIRLS